MISDFKGILHFILTKVKGRIVIFFLTYNGNSIIFMKLICKKLINYED